MRTVIMILGMTFLTAQYSNIEIHWVSSVMMGIVAGAMDMADFMFTINRSTN